MNLACLVCRQKRQAARFYQRERADPVRWAARKKRQRDRARLRYQADPAYRKMILTRNSNRYWENPDFRARVLSRRRAVRAKP